MLSTVAYTTRKADGNYRIDAPCVLLCRCEKQLQSWCPVDSKVTPPGAAVHPARLRCSAQTTVGQGGQGGLDLGAVVVGMPDRDLSQALDPAITGLQVLG